MQRGVSGSKCHVVGPPVAYGLETFKNRVREVDRMIDHVAAPGTRMVTVVGRRGVGKSALAARVAELLAGADPRPTAGVELAGVVNISSRRADCRWSASIWTARAWSGGTMNVTCSQSGQAGGPRWKR
jgi:hypothetical protein